MNRERPAAWRELMKSAEDPVERADGWQRTQTEGSVAWRSRPAGCANREAWRRILAAHIQSPPAAD